MSGREVVEAVRAAAKVHKTTREMMVPDRFTVDLSFEPTEEAAYAEMAAAKAMLREQICATYGIWIRELSSLAMP